MSQLIQFAPQVERLSGALFQKNNEATIKVFGKEAKVILEGFVEAMTKKDESRSIFGRLNCKAVKMESKGGKERLVLVFDGGVQGFLFKNTKKSEEFLEADNSPDYTGEIADENHVFPLFGRNAESKKGEVYISLSTGTRKPRSPQEEQE